MYLQQERIQKQNCKLSVDICSHKFKLACQLWLMFQIGMLYWNTPPAQILCNDWHFVALPKAAKYKKPPMSALVIEIPERLTGRVQNCVPVAISSLTTRERRLHLCVFELDERWKSALC